MNRFFSLFVLCLAVAEICAVDWCAVQTRICKGKLHSACPANTFTKGTCTNVQVVPMTASMMATFVGHHNKLRNQLAGGQVTNYPSASRMMEMKWDNELAETATAHIKNCNFAHDVCRGTDTFPSAGQNLAFAASTAASANQTTTVINAIQAWFDEYKLVSSSVVDNFDSTYMSAGHFTVMSREKNTHVGCGYITYTYVKDGRTWYGNMIACNYADNNWIGTPMYQRGAATSKCSDFSKTASTVFPSLCAV